MATPYCQRDQCFATMAYCHEHCSAPMSTRRPACQYRRHRQWTDLDEYHRQVMMGNKERNAEVRRLDTYLGRRAQSEALRLACQRHLAAAEGRGCVLVPVDTLQKLLQLLETLSKNAPSPLRMEQPMMIGAQSY